ncbi:unnamed protein product [Ectocarpus sp. 12 AP-2014]
MGVSRRCSALAAFVALASVPSECQAFINCCLRAGERTPPSAATTSTTSFRHSSSGWCRTARAKDCGALLMSEVAEDYPSDTGDDRFAGGAGTAEQERLAFTEKDTPEVAQLKLDLLRIAALTGRGQLATPAERGRVEDVIWELEMRTPVEDTATSTALLGRWALVYASEDATRSSPFFWAFRKATEGIKPPFGGGGDGDGFDGSTVAATIFAITDSLPGKSVGEAVQTITEKEIKSEVEIFAGASAGSDKRGKEGPNTFPSFRSVMTTTSEIMDAAGTETKLRVANTQVRKSALGRLLKPLFNLDDIEFQTDNLLTPLKEGSTEVSMTTTYLDGLLRVSRNEQGQVFVFAREDDGELR